VVVHDFAAAIMVIDPAGSKADKQKSAAAIAHATKQTNAIARATKQAETALAAAAGVLSPNNGRGWPEPAFTKTVEVASKRRPERVRPRRSSPGKGRGGQGRRRVRVRARNDVRHGEHGYFGRH